MAEYNGKEGHWVTYNGRHLFISDDPAEKQEQEIKAQEEATKKLTAEKRGEPLSKKELDNIEYEVLCDYADNVIKKDKFSDKWIDGKIWKRRDADDTYSVSGSCKIPGETIKGWIVEDFTGLADEYCEKHKVDRLGDLKKGKVWVDEDEYREFLEEKCRAIYDYWEDSDMWEYLSEQYFEEYGEED